MLKRIGHQLEDKPVLSVPRLQGATLCHVVQNVKCAKMCKNVQNVQNVNSPKFIENLLNRFRIKI